MAMSGFGSFASLFLAEIGIGKKKALAFGENSIPFVGLWLVNLQKSKKSHWKEEDKVEKELRLTMSAKSHLSLPNERSL